LTLELNVESVVFDAISILQPELAFVADPLAVGTVVEPTATDCGRMRTAHASALGCGIDGGAWVFGYVGLIPSGVLKMAPEVKTASDMAVYAWTALWGTAGAMSASVENGLPQWQP
jgi:hypothetical protein